MNSPFTLTEIHQVPLFFNTSRYDYEPVSWLSGFVRDTRGTISAAFAMTGLVATMLVGASIDYSRNIGMQQKLQASVDAAMLAALQASAANRTSALRLIASRARQVMASRAHKRLTALRCARAPASPRTTTWPVSNFAPRQALAMVRPWCSWRP